MSTYNSHSLTLYCDNLNAKHVDHRGTVQVGEHGWGEIPAQFDNPKQKICYQLARQSGWKFYKDGRNLCPRCVHGGIKL